ncbi:MAG: hypothetical protein A3D39_03475 [Candidatus Buchananbacteria bacterium RIFCSPHIGHO2_02_FULL_39_17]|nr:MAG: hypothetical protein A3D39_03475 [Candidatus Buchananbacteria bacterium RIFCSPHIGHO2_02_FULL_39_17]
MKFISARKIVLEKPLSELDQLVLRFVNIVQKYTSYVIISGYVAILLGRSRGTEDVDLFVKKMSFEDFMLFYTDLKNEGFWCLNADDVKEIYSYLVDGLAVRFAINGETIPNFEVKFALKPIQLVTFDDCIEVVTEQGVIIISSLERQIAFKRYYLMSDKDLEDAKHVEEVFKGHIDVEKIKKYKVFLENYNE